MKKISLPEQIVIKKSYLMALLFVFGLVIGIFAGYYFGLQSQKGGTGAEQVVKNDGKLFIKYAEDLKLDKKKFESCINSGKYATEVNSDSTLAVRIGLTGTPAFIINGRVASGAVSYDDFKQMFDIESTNSSNRSLALSIVNPKDPTKGNKDAPIVMIEFSDFQCPYCGAFAGAKNAAYNSLKSRDPTWEAAYPGIIENYVQTGKVFLVFKDFPLSNIHPSAQKAAEAANCANEQGKFWEYHDILFEKQSEWSG